MPRRQPVPSKSARLISPAARNAVPFVGALLTPAAALGYAMSFWRFAADMRWTGQFPVSDGLLSRWQVWLAIAAAIQASAHYLGRSTGPGTDGTVAS